MFEPGESAGIVGEEVNHVTRPTKRKKLHQLKDKPKVNNASNEFEGVDMQTLFVGVWLTRGTFQSLERKAVEN
jgi:hypothetical protein